MSKDYYKILEVDRGASQDDIKKAFRKKAHQYHPDKSTGDEEKFKEINEAYQVLSDEKKRSQYDQFGSSFDGAQGGMNWQDFSQGFGGGHGQGMNFDFGDLGDIFGDIFGGGGKRHGGSSRGADIEVFVSLTFDEAIFGTEKEIDIQKIIVCDQCKGVGAASGSEIITCATCQGRGKVTVMQNILFGQVQTSRVCSTCNGKGKSFKNRCASCIGEGIKRGSENIRFSIPAGVNDGEVVRLSGKGNAGRDGLNGDLYIRINVKESLDFHREGSDIRSDVLIKLSQALLGTKLEIKTVHGFVTLKIPEGTASGTVFRLKGHGVPHINRSGKGDHFVTVNINIPKSLTRSQKKIVTDLEKEGL